jgi:hypothetical protein
MRLPEENSLDPSLREPPFAYAARLRLPFGSS